MIVFPNINRTQDAERAAKYRFFVLVTLTFKLERWTLRSSLPAVKTDQPIIR